MSARILVIAVLLSVCAGGWIAAAQEADAIDARLAAAGAALLDVDSMAVKVTYGLTLVEGDRKDEMLFDFAITAKRPNLTVLNASEAGGGEMQIQVVCDGEKLYQYVPSQKEYLERKAPDAIGKVITSVGEGPFRIGSAWLGELFSAEPLTRWTGDKVARREHVGVEEVDGVKVDHYRFVLKEYDVEMWIDQGEKPLVRRGRFDVTRSLGASAGGGAAKRSIVLELNLSEWQLGIETNDETFAFNPPEDVKKVEGPPSEREHPLTGEAAPAFELEVLGGGTVSLESLKGKIVVLDFWATWCGPCARALPAIVSVTDEFKDKGVVFYAVNLREEPEKVRAFLERLEVSCNVALDKDGATGAAYQAKGIPQSVVIGKTGVIEAIHVGANPSLESELRSELETLVSGKSLAGEKSE